MADVYPLGPAATDFMSDAFLADLRLRRTGCMSWISDST
jgi:hypothetical protein